MALPKDTFAVFNIGGGEIILILVLFLILAAVVVGFLGLIYVIVRAVQNRPAPVPSALPPEIAAQNQERRDREHLKLLTIFHFVFAGLALVGEGFLGVHYAIMHTVFSNPQMWKSQSQNMPPKDFLDVFVWFYLFMGLILLAVLVLNVLSGIFLRQKKYRFFSLIIAGLDCLQIPFGTALGVFTIFVLTRDSVRRLYETEAST
jgi:hypothetical protein